MKLCLGMHCHKVSRALTELLITTLGRNHVANHSILLTIRRVARPEYLDVSMLTVSG